MERFWKTEDQGRWIARLVDAFENPSDRRMKRLKELWGREEVENTDVDHVIESLRHYFGMGIEAIDTMRFGSRRPSDILDEMRRIERRYIEKKKKDDDVLDMNEYPEDYPITKVIEFDDGSAWFRIDRPSCSIEAKYGGHCGNKNFPYGNIIYSYRVPVNEYGNRITDPSPKHRWWKILLTFTVEDDGNGNREVVERRGWGNTKPSKKYHKYIKALLDSPYVTGISDVRLYDMEKGNYFQLKDLFSSYPAQMIAEMIEKKPGLVNTNELLNILNIMLANGSSAETLTRLLKSVLGDEYEEYKDNILIYPQGIFLSNDNLTFEELMDHVSSETLRTFTQLQEVVEGDQWEIEELMEKLVEECSLEIDIEELEHDKDFIAAFIKMVEHKMNEAIENIMSHSSELFDMITFTVVGKPDGTNTKLRWFVDPSYTEDEKLSTKNIIDVIYDPLETLDVSSFALVHDPMTIEDIITCDDFVDLVERYLGRN